jgi:NADH dehydrogenase
VFPLEPSKSATQLLAHIYFLIGFRNRLVVLMDWAMAYSSFSRNARVVAGTLYKKEHVGES